MSCWRQVGFGLLVWLVCTASGAEPRLAISIDDLPWSSLGEHARADLNAQHERLIKALRAIDAPLLGLVNESKLEKNGVLQPARVRMLLDWLDLGAELGNHGYAHLDLHAVGMADYQADILRGERVLRPLLAARGQAPRWFRPPYLRAGRTDDDKHALTEFLQQHGYRLAPVTIDNSDWIWARAYRRQLDRHPANRALLDRLRNEYLHYMLAKVDYYRDQGRSLLGYELAQVLLLHANEINGHTIERLVKGIRERGYRIASMDEVMQDPAYARADGYHGAFGPSWLHRWAMSEKKPASFYAGEPLTPDWVLQLAGVESE